MTSQYDRYEIPLVGRAEADDLGGLAVLLASDASSYVIGQVIVQDRGQSTRL